MLTYESERPSGQQLTDSIARNQRTISDCGKCGGGSPPRLRWLLGLVLPPLLPWWQEGDKSGMNIQALNPYSVIFTYVVFLGQGSSILHP